MKVKIKSIFNIAIKEYMSWLFTSKMILFLVVMIPIREMIIIPIRNEALSLGQPLQFMESNIAIFNSVLAMPLLALCYLVLIASFPTMGENTLFRMFRVGRVNWMIGEFLFQIMAALTFSLIEFGFAFINIADVSFIDDGWSLVITENEKISLIEPNVYYQMSPYKAFSLSFLLFFLFLLLNSVVFTMGCVYGKRLQIFIIQSAIVSMGFLLQFVSSKYMWLFPGPHAMIKPHFHKVFREYVMSPANSIIYYTVLIVLFCAITFRKARTVSLDTLEVARK